MVLGLRAAAQASAGKRGEPMTKRGRKMGDAAVLAETLGISKRVVLRIGLDRVAAMSPEALGLLVGMSKETSRKMCDGVDEPSTAAIRARHRERRIAKRRRARKDATSVEGMMELAGRVG